MKKIIIICVILLSQPTFAKYRIHGNMDALYEGLIIDNKNDKEYVEKVKETQEKWHEFLNAQIELLFSPEVFGSRNDSNDGIDYKENIDKAVMNETKWLFYNKDD